MSGVSYYYCAAMTNILDYIQLGILIIGAAVLSV